MGSPDGYDVGMDVGFSVEQKVTSLGCKGGATQIILDEE